MEDSCVEVGAGSTPRLQDVPSQWTRSLVPSPQMSLAAAPQRRRLGEEKDGNGKAAQVPPSKWSICAALLTQTSPGPRPKTLSKGLALGTFTSTHDVPS